MSTDSDVQEKTKRYIDMGLPADMAEQIATSECDPVKRSARIENALGIYRRWKSGEPREKIFGNTQHLSHDPLMRCIDTLAEAYSELILSRAGAADDGELPVTEEWLRSACGNQRCHAVSLGLTLAFQKDAIGRWWVTAMQDDESVVLAEPKTRRDVRDLCRCLGVPLPSPAAGTGEEGQVQS